MMHGQISFKGDGYVKLEKRIVSHEPDVKNEITLEFSTWYVLCFFTNDE